MVSFRGSVHGLSKETNTAHAMRGHGSNWNSVMMSLLLQVDIMVIVEASVDETLQH